MDQPSTAPARQPFVVVLLVLCIRGNLTEVTVPLLSLFPPNAGMSCDLPLPGPPVVELYRRYQPRQPITTLDLRRSSAPSHCSAIYRAETSSQPAALCFPRRRSRWPYVHSVGRLAPPSQVEHSLASCGKAIRPSSMKPNAGMSCGQRPLMSRQTERPAATSPICPNTERLVLAVCSIPWLGFLSCGHMKPTVRTSSSRGARLLAVRQHRQPTRTALPG